MLPAVENNEKRFKHYLDLPQEIRTIVINEMDPDDRCEFSRCSTSSNREAKSSKNYIYGLGIAVRNEEDILVTITYGDFNNLRSAYSFFGKEDMNWPRHTSRGNKYLKCSTRNGEQNWEMELSPLTNLVQYSIQYFKKLLRRYHNNIKRLDVDMNSFVGPIDLEISSLRSLEYLTVHDDIYGQQLLSKTQRVLKEFTGYDCEGDGFPMEKIYQVQHDLNMSCLKLNNAQFLQLSAASIRIDIGHLTPEDIFNFIRSWQNGNIERNVLAFTWILRGSDFDIQELFRLFGEFEQANVTVHHFKDAWKSARVFRSVGDTLRVVFKNY